MISAHPRDTLLCERSPAGTCESHNQKAHHKLTEDAHRLSMLSHLIGKVNAAMLAGPMIEALSIVISQFQLATLRLYRSLQPVLVNNLPETRSPGEPGP